MVETLGEDHVRTTRPKGVGPWQVLMRHGWRPAAVPLVPLIGLYFITVMGGSVLIEQVFDRPGLGEVLVRGDLNNSDYPLVQGVVIVYAAIVVVGTILY